jgi:hypothetical protein
MDWQAARALHCGWPRRVPIFTKEASIGDIGDCLIGVEANSIRCGEAIRDDRYEAYVGWEWYKFSELSGGLTSLCLPDTRLKR